ncbi:MAG: alpha/beta hydrolase [Hyphomicrobiaceae bacterium]|nr:alpha/beta hydrolase [Hyphomicrobiaceae bacterium]
MLDYEVEYNNRQRVPEHVEINARWQRASAAYRATARADLDQAYGPGERHRYDLFMAGQANAPLVVYIHGGYWQRGDRRDYAFLAQALNTRGLDVALPSYALCPAASVMDIVAELRSFLVALWRKTGKHALVTGHSAGGHLTAAMLATDWNRVAGVPTDLVRTGIAVSGVFDLGPLVGTSLNDALGLDASAAREASPLFWPPPPAGRVLVAAVGGAESREFLRQSREITTSWQSAGVSCQYLEVPKANHFTVVDELVKPDSALSSKLAECACA